MARLIYFILLFMCLILQTIQHKFDDDPKYLTMYRSDGDSDQRLIINGGDVNQLGDIVRTKRDVLKSATKGGTAAAATSKPTNPNSDVINPRNISTMVC